MELIDGDSQESMTETKISVFHKTKTIHMPTSQPVKVNY